MLAGNLWLLAFKNAHRLSPLDRNTSRHPRRRRHRTSRVRYSEKKQTFPTSQINLFATCRDDVAQFIFTFSLSSTFAQCINKMRRMGVVSDIGAHIIAHCSQMP